MVVRDPRNKENLAVTTTRNDEEKRVKSREEGREREREKEE